MCTYSWTAYHRVAGTHVHVYIQLKEQEIKRQFQDAAKIQQKQFKVYRSHQLAKTSKAEQKELMKRMKEEQLRRMAMLSQQYDASIAEMIERQNVSNNVFCISFCRCIGWDVYDPPFLCL